MNRQEVLHGLNNAVTLFQQQEALSQEYERVQQKDRPYEEECYRRRQSEENAQILNELERQSFKQNVQIAQSMAETAALSAQLATANKQLADMKKELAELKRGDSNRR